MIPRRKILLVCDGAFYPAKAGSPLRLLQLATLLDALGELHVLTVGHRDDDASMPLGASWLHLDKKDHPETSSSTIDRTIRVFRRRQFPLENDRVTGRLNAAVRRHVRAIAPDLVVLSNWHDAFPDALRASRNVIIDAHNVESQLAERLFRSAGRLSLRQRYTLAAYRRSERALLERAAQVWFTSEVDERDARLVTAKIRSTVVVPNAVDTASYASARDRAAEVTAPTILYAGSYCYPPNALAAEMLVERVFPLVRASFPGARLVLAGKEPTPYMTAAAARDAAIVVTGSVPSMRPYFAEADVTAIPIFEGGGTRLKILEAFAAGIPVVTTAKGVEGIDAAHGVSVRVADDAEGLARETVAVLRDAAGRAAQIAAARELVERSYSWGAIASHVGAAIDRVAPPRVAVAASDASIARSAVA